MPRASVALKRLAMGAPSKPAGAHTDQEFVELHIVHHDGPMKCPPEEVAYGEWFPPADITAWVAARPQDFAKGFVTCWKAYQHHSA